MGLGVAYMLLKNQGHKKYTRKSNGRKLREEQRKQRDEEYQKQRAEELYERRHSIEGLNECILKEIAYHDNPELLEFFSYLYECGLRIDRHDAKEHLMEGRKLAEELNSQFARIEILREKAEKTGVKFEQEYKGIKLIEFHHVKKLADSSLNYSYNFTKSLEVCKLFNGLALTEEMLKDPDYSGFRDEYERIKQLRVHPENEADDLKAKLEENKKKLRFSIFRRNALKRENEEIEERLSKIERDKKAIEEAEEKRDAFASLTPEQKELILEYLQTVRYCEHLEEQAEEQCRIADTISPEKSDYIYWHRDKYGEKPREKWKRALKLMIEEGLITREQLSDILHRIEEVQEKQHRNEYDADFKQWSSDKDAGVGHFNKAITWFLNSYYRTKGESEKDKDEELK